MDKITVSKERGQWMATMWGEKTREWVRLFGTATIPTPFSATAPAAMVLAKIQALNPGVTVTLAGRD